MAAKLMTKHFREAEADYIRAQQARRHGEDDKTIDEKTMGKISAKKNLPPDFPIERARLRALPWITALFAASTGVYGYTLAFPRSVLALPGWIAVPLALQLVMAAASNAVFALNQTLVTDLCPGKGASGTAVNNLVRCGLAAVGVSFAEPMIAALGGPGPAFLGLGLAVVACVPLPVMHWVWGADWRRRAAARTAAE